MSESVAAALQPYLDRQALAGAITLVADRDGVRHHAAHGWADQPAGRPLQPDDLIWIASQTKAINAAAVLLLVDEGRLSPDDALEQHLPEFRGQLVVVERDEQHLLLRPPAAPITVRQALSHTSGLPFSSPAEQPTLDALPLDVATRTYAALHLDSEPGTRYQYSNAGTNAAARLIEVLTGQRYEHFLQERLLNPLGMHQTTFWPSPEQLTRLAAIHRPNAAGDGLETAPFHLLSYPLDDRVRRYAMPAGGLFATASDIARFARMVLRGGELDGRRYLSEAAVELMTTRQTASDLPECYGLGWSVGPETASHGGACGSYHAVDWRHGLVLVYHIQHSGWLHDGPEAGGAFGQAARAAYGG
ncbi:MAG: beta-lactamase family protein [Fimbriimonadaceae bacterium]|nr:beta-lactamase family protein [Fimbriimonadaceae bacterium]